MVVPPAVFGEAKDPCPATENRNPPLGVCAAASAGLKSWPPRVPQHVPKALPIVVGVYLASGYVVY